MAFGALDARGIYHFGEDDTEANFSSLMNLLSDSVSGAMKFYAGTLAERDAFADPPPGAIWQESQGAYRRWVYRGEAWVTTGLTVGTLTGVNGTEIVSQSLARDEWGIVTCEFICRKPSPNVWVNGQRAVNIPTGFRPTLANNTDATSYGSSAPAWVFAEFLDAGANIAFTRTPALAAADLISFKKTWRTNV